MVFGQMLYKFLYTTKFEIITIHSNLNQMKNINHALHLFYNVASKEPKIKPIQSILCKLWDFKS